MQSGGTINVSSILSGKRVAKLELGVGVRVRVGLRLRLGLGLANPHPNPSPPTLPLTPKLTRCIAKLAAGDALPQLHDVTSAFMWKQ